MLANHLDVAEPVAPVLHRSIVAGLHDKRGCCIIDIVFTRYRGIDILHFFLASHVANDHFLHYLPRSLRVCVNSVCTFFLD